jgi:hypothetical protein
MINLKLYMASVIFKERKERSGRRRKKNVSSSHYYVDDVNLAIRKRCMRQLLFKKIYVSLINLIMTNEFCEKILISPIVNSIIFFTRRIKSSLHYLSKNNQ